MIPKYRNRAFKSLGLSLLLTGIIGGLILSGRFYVPVGFIVTVSVALGIVALILYLQGCMALAHAKGYHSIMVPVIVLAPFVCVAPFFLFLPVVIILAVPLMLLIPIILAFGLKEKNAL
jgi:hypothetical protein